MATAWNNGSKIVVDSISGIHAVYQNITLPHEHGPGQPTTSHSVTYAYSTDRGISWEHTSFGSAYYPSIAVGPDTVPHIVLLAHMTKVGEPPPNEFLMHYWRNQSGDWGSEIIDDVAFPTFGKVFTPAIAVDQSNIPHVVWEYSDTSLNISRIYYWTPSLSSPEEIVAGGIAHSVQFPTIAIDGFTPHVLWQDNVRGEIRHSYREGADTWHEPHFTVADEASHPCADESDGVIYAVWEEGSLSDIFIGRFTGTDWEGCPVWNTVNPSQFPVLEDSNVVWSEPTQIPGDRGVFYSKWGGGLVAELTCGSQPEKLSQTPSLSTYPQGCYHSLGEVWHVPTPICDRFYVVWTQEHYSHQRLMFTDHVPLE